MCFYDVGHKSRLIGKSRVKCRCRWQKNSAECFSVSLRIKASVHMLGVALYDVIFFSLSLSLRFSAPGGITSFRVYRLHFPVLNDDFEHFTVLY